MTASEIMTSDVEVVDREASLQEAAFIMTCAGVGTLPVVAGERVVGVITCRDIIVRAVAEGLGCWDTRVREVMSAEPVACGVDVGAAEIGRLMVERGVGRVIVVDGAGRLAGIVTRADLRREADFAAAIAFRAGASRARPWARRSSSRPFATGSRLAGRRY